MVRVILIRKRRWKLTTWERVLRHLRMLKAISCFPCWSPLSTFPFLPSFPWTCHGTQGIHLFMFSSKQWQHVTTCKQVRRPNQCQPYYTLRWQWCYLLTAQRQIVDVVFLKSTWSQLWDNFKKLGDHLPKELPPPVFTAQRGACWALCRAIFLDWSTTLHSAVLYF